MVMVSLSFITSKGIKMKKLLMIGFLILGFSLQTYGVFAAGDIADVSGEFQQIIIAVAEGARAALSVYQHLKSKDV